MSQMDLGKVSELRADRALLNPNFENYLLTTRRIEMRKVDLPSSVHRIAPSAEQWAYQHVKLFEVPDQLIIDAFSSNNTESHLYMFLDTGAIVKTVYKTNLANFFSLTEVAKISFCPSLNDCFPPSLLFANSQHAIVSNGAGKLIIYQTYDRTASNQSWTKIFSTTITTGTTESCFVLNDTTNQNLVGVPFVLLDCRSLNENSLCILLHTVVINKTDENDQPNGRHVHPFVSRLIWLDVELNVDNVPVVKRHREAIYNAHLEFATLNSDATKLVTVGPTNAIFVYDSEKTIDLAKFKTNLNVSETSKPEKPIYIWTQDAEEITISFSLAENVTRADVQYKLTSNIIEVAVKNVVLLAGELEGAVHLDASKWMISDNSLEVTLFKVRGHYWRELVKGDNRGLYQTDPKMMEKALASLNKFTSDCTESFKTTNADMEQGRGFNVEQMEECDETSSDTLFISWNDGDIHRCLQSKDVSSSQLLFTTRLQAGRPCTLATRHDHDGVVWSLDAADLAPNQQIVHKYTLNAFGYVQAGHAQKVFSGCAPDGSYAVVVHPNHHVFVYLQSVPTSKDCHLRNRRTQSDHGHVAEQLVINTTTLFENNTQKVDFIGCQLTNTVIYLLSQNHVIACRIA